MASWGTEGPGEGALRRNCRDGEGGSRNSQAPGVPDPQPIHWSPCPGHCPQRRQTRQPAALEGPSKAGQLSPGASLDTLYLLLLSLPLPPCIPSLKPGREAGERGRGGPPGQYSQVQPGCFPRVDGMMREIRLVPPWNTPSCAIKTHSCLNSHSPAGRKAARSFPLSLQPAVLVFGTRQTCLPIPHSPPDRRTSISEKRLHHGCSSLMQDVDNRANRAHGNPLLCALCLMFP